MKIIFFKYFVAVLSIVLVSQWLAWAVEVIPEKPILEFYNKSYIAAMKLDIRKRSRNSPYYIDLIFNALSAFGNNVTVNFQLMEYLGSGWQPMPIKTSMKLCDFLYKEPFLGQMYAKQLPAGWSCPFKIGWHNFTNLVIHLENFPYNLPFTWASINVKTRADIEGLRTDTTHILFTFKVYVTFIMKPPKKNK